MSFDDVLDLTTDDLFFFIILYYNVTPYIVRAIDVPYAACKVEFGEIPDLTAEEKGMGGVTVYIITIQSTSPTREPRTTQNMCFKKPFSNL